MEAFINTIKALLRRMAVISASALITFILTDWPKWTEQAFKASSDTAAVWPFIYLIVEFLQKYVRENVRQRKTWQQ